MAQEKKVQLVGGETVSYDYLIIATGTGGPFPCKLGMNVNEKEGLASYDEMSQLVRKVHKIILLIPCVYKTMYKLIEHLAQWKLPKCATQAGH